ncbi:unnamed protein product [Heligmosomoides polygyrus]|uniref:CUT domain-containing protein n=1 Tax=Heligmosomoides polygyrus TaxID=6339 RepID=A0A3P8DE44_HELPZ|nr:unnamed protein product [Heligmosomoides polygyrus]
MALFLYLRVRPFLFGLLFCIRTVLENKQKKHLGLMCEVTQCLLAARRVYSTKDSNDPLNAEIDDDIYIDTKELCKRIAYELKQHSIPQAIFAERILCRSQGTLSDLLRNPKPWNKLKSGRETFRRMFNWVQQPLAMRLGILDMYKQGCGMSPPTPAQNPSNKRPRLVFTDIQKRTLQVHHCSLLCLCTLRQVHEMTSGFES